MEKPASRSRGKWLSIRRGIKRTNLYQIFTYVKNKDTEFGDKPHKVSGMLLYAATDEAIQPDNSYQMSGNKISVKTLDLNRDFSEIAAQLNAIVDEHFEEKSTQNIG